MLHTGISWEHLPQELGFGSGRTCWRRLAEWHEAGVWRRLHEVLLAKLRAADALDFSRTAVSSHVRALDKYRRLVRELGVWPLITRRNTEHGSGLGTQRWVVERAFALLHHFRRLRIRWELCGDMHDALLRLGCAVICWRRLASLRQEF